MQATKLIIRDKVSGEDEVWFSERFVQDQSNLAYNSGRDSGLEQGRKESAIKFERIDVQKFSESQTQSAKEIVIRFLKWMQENDTQEHAEEFFGYTDEDMFNHFINLENRENVHSS